MVDDIYDDIFADCRTRYCLVAGPEVHGGSKRHHLIVMTDFEYWNSRANEVVQWCRNNKCRIEGMTIWIPSDHRLTAFLLKWV